MNVYMHIFCCTLIIIYLILIIYDSITVWLVLSCGECGMLIIFMYAHATAAAEFLCLCLGKSTRFLSAWSQSASQGLKARASRYIISLVHDVHGMP